jgi:hypothetical protein
MTIGLVDFGMTAMAAVHVAVTCLVNELEPTAIFGCARKSVEYRMCKF